MNEPITVWKFDDAPAELQELSTNGGDEDWLAEVPSNHCQPHHPVWMKEGGPYGCCSVEWHDHPTRDDWKVAIGSHA